MNHDENTQSNTERETFINVITARIKSGARRVAEFTAEALEFAGRIFTSAVVGFVEGVIVFEAVNALVVYGSGKTLTLVGTAATAGTTSSIPAWVAAITTGCQSAATWLAAALPASLSSLANPWVVAAAIAVVLAVIIYVEREQITAFFTVWFQGTMQLLAWGIEGIRNVLGAALFFLNAVITWANATTAVALWALKHTFDRLAGNTNTSLKDAYSEIQAHRTTPDVPSEGKGQPTPKAPQNRRPHPARQKRHLKPVTG